MITTSSTLNEQYAIPGHVHFENGPGGILTAVIENELASASMPLLGANVLTYAPRGQKPVLWTAPHEVFQPGKALHSGVPVCWPWFGAHPDNPKLPVHGLVRTQLWSVTGTRALHNGATEVGMAIQDSDATRAIWPYPFELKVTAVFGKALDLSWEAMNPGKEPFRYTGAFHPYFAVSEASVVTVHGLDGVDYLDKVEDFARKTQHGPITFEDWTDRVYLDTTAEVTIEDPGFARRITIIKQGSRNTVVWNPKDQDVTMPAIGAGGHKTFICVEAANAFTDVQEVLPGGAGHLSMHIECTEGRSE